MKKVKLLILGILSVIGLSSITFGYTSNGITYQNGIYRTFHDGLLTYIYNDTAITVADKYIGQSVYQLSGEVPLGSASLFLQGNNFAFEYGETYPQGLSISDGSIYGPGNYLNTGILPNSSNWVSSNYSNMWGADYGTFEAMKGPCPLGFHVMSSGEFIDFFNLVSSLGCFEELSIYSRGVYFLNGSLVDNNSYGYSLSNLFGIGYIRGGFCQGGTISNYGKTNLYPVRCVRDVLRLPTSNYRTVEYQGSLEGLPEEPEYENPLDTISITGSDTSSLYYNCLGPTYNTLDGLPPAYCYDSSGNLDPQRFKDCYTTVEVLETGFVSHNFCNIDGYFQEIVLVEDGSGFSIIPGQNNTNVLDYLNPGYSVEFFENYLNSTGYFFKCPFPYTQKLVIRPKLITLLNGYDLALPINCSFAGFEKGKSLFNFSNSGHFIEGGPIINFDGENANVLYRFFDFCLILVFILLFSKIYKLFK